MSINEDIPMMKTRVTLSYQDIEFICNGLGDFEDINEYTICQRLRTAQDRILAKAVEMEP